MSGEPAIADIGTLLVHALELEHEAAAHYETLADSMALHHNAGAAALFRRLAELTTRRAEDIAARARGIALPRIAPWSFQWRGGTSPKTDGLSGDIGYRMTAAQALQFAVRNETSGHGFYLSVAAAATDAEVAALAATLADAQARHLLLLKGQLARETRDTAPADDLDPPHLPG